MATYLNCYTLLEKVRVLLNEYSAAYVQGTDTTGKYNNAQIVDGINAARRYIYNLLLKRIPHEFEKETTLVGVNSVYTLPADFGVLRYFKDSDGCQIYKIGQNQRKVTGQTGSDQHYYRRAGTLILDKSGVTETCTLIYYKKCRELDQGVSTAGGALSLTLASTAKKIVDYYNDMMIENVTDDWTDTISDYSSARVCTIAQTGAASKYYGIICDMPEPFHYLYPSRAVFEITGNYPVVQEKPTQSGFELFNQNFVATLKAYAGEALDSYPEDIWCEYGYSLGSLSEVDRIPGH